MPAESEKKLHPGRKWFVLLALVALLCGAAIGWSGEKPLYQSQAVLYVEPSMRSAINLKLLPLPRLIVRPAPSTRTVKLGRGRRMESLYL